MKCLISSFQALRGAFKIVVFLAMVTMLVPCALLYKWRYPNDALRLPMIFHRHLLRLLNIKVRIYGGPCALAPVFFVSNHSSYLDIPVLGALLPASFVAKAEVARWPLFGFLAKVQNTLFIERRSTRAADQRTKLHDHLVKKHNLILFPEGTSTDGLTVLPFKSSLFGIVENAAEGIEPVVQPISITCTEKDGRPILRRERDEYAWYGDMTLEPHLWAVFQRARFTVEVIFHKPLSPKDFSDRKSLAMACQIEVSRGIEQSLTGHADAPLKIKRNI